MEAKFVGSCLQWISESMSDLDVALAQEGGQMM